MKGILVSIQPKYLLEILEGAKTIEVRKTIPKNFKGWVYLYCTRSEPHLIHIVDHGWKLSNRLPYDWRDIMHYYNLSGTIVARFWFDSYETYICGDTQKMYTDVDEYDISYESLEKTSLDYRELWNYGKGKTLYGWKIQGLEIFDYPLFLEELKLKRAPQSWMYIQIDIKQKEKA